MMRDGRVSPKALAALVSGVVLVSMIVVSGLALNGRLVFASSGRHTLPGHLIPALAHAQARSHTNANASLELSIGLTLRNRAQLDALLAATGAPRRAVRQWSDTGAPFGYWPGDEPGPHAELRGHPRT